MNERGDSVNGEYFEWSEAVRAATRCEVPVDGVAVRVPRVCLGG